MAGKVYFKYRQNMVYFHKMLEGSTAMFSDFHVHTDFSGDSDTPARDQLNQAVRMGMEEVCITDHHDYDTAFTEIDFTLDIDAYLPYIMQMKGEYEGRLKVQTGIELGLQLHLKDYLNQLTEKYHFDFIIGSSHFVDRQDPYYPAFFEGRAEKEAYRRFFEVTLKRVRELDCYDVIGHLDYVVRYGPTANQNYSYQEYREYIDPILKTLIEHGKGLECNTGGYKYGLGHPNPTEEILLRYRQLGGEILTIGSDAHEPKYLGYEFERTKDVLLDCGYRYYTVFRDRKPEFKKIS